MPDSKRRASEANVDDIGNPRKVARVDWRKLLAPSVIEKLEDLYRSGRISEDDLDNEAILKLSEFFPSDGATIVKIFEKADLATVRNKSAYMCRAMAKYRDNNRCGGLLADDVLKKLNELSQAGLIKQNDLDGRCFEALESMGPEFGMRVLNAYASKNLSLARNPCAVFMATIKEVSSELHHAKDVPSRHQVSNGSLSRNTSSYTTTQPFVDLMPGSISATGISQLNAMQDGNHIPMPANPNMPRLLGRTYYGVDHAEYGVRVQEFHQVNPLAPYVHPAAALKLQNLWDKGIKLVALMTDESWECIAELEGAESLAVIDEVATHMADIPEHQVAACLVATARPFLENKRPFAAAVGTFGGNDLTSTAPFGAMGGSGAYVPSVNLSRGVEEPGFSRRSSSRHSAYGQEDDKAFSLLPHNLRKQAEYIIDSSSGRYLKRYHFDHLLVTQLTNLPTAEAESIFEELGKNDLSNVRNMPAFITGIIKRKSRQ